MKTVRVVGASLCGAAAELVEIEARFEPSEREASKIVLTGLPDAVMRESRGRLLTALRASKLAIGPGQLHLNLLPAGRPKSGEMLDLPMAIGAAAAVGHIESTRLRSAVFLGGVGIDGRLQDVPGGLAAALAARARGLGALVAAPRTAAEAAVLPELRVRSGTHLGEVAAWLSGYDEALAVPPSGSDPGCDPHSPGTPRLSEVRGQTRGKRALMVAAAGGHALLFVGPPGTGKSMLARVLPGLLPAPELAERIEITRVLSAAAQWPRGLVESRPFRAPHHTTSYAGLVGGGNPPRAGEITRAHGGVLFLDELPEFRREVLEALRQPLETGTVLVARAGGPLEMPCRFQLVGAMNPCPCGFRGHPRIPCRCTPTAVGRYRAHLSGPLLDRIDLRVELPAPEVHELLPPERDASPRGVPTAEPERYPQTVDATAATAISTARRRALERPPGIANALLSVDQLDRSAPLTPGVRRLLERVVEERGASIRALQSLRRVARTVADLDSQEEVSEVHLAEAIGLRDPVAG